MRPTVRIIRRSHHGGIAKLKPPRPGQVMVGFPAGKSSSSAITHAIFNEFGTRTIPERPFMRNAMRSNLQKYRDIMRNNAKRLLSEGASVRTVLGKLGVMAQGDVQASITALTSPPNARSTIEQKGSDNPLIDSGEMRKAVTWKVQE